MKNATSKKVTISDGRHLRALNTCKSKFDKRLPLRYILLDLDKNEMVSTDGHRCFVAQCVVPEDGLKGRYLIRPTSNIPKTWMTASIDLDTGIMVGYSKSQAPFNKPVVCELTDEANTGDFPPVEKVINRIPCSGKGAVKISVNCKLLADVQQAVGAEGVEFNLNEQNAIRCRLRGFNPADEYEFVVMPMHGGK